MAFAKALATNLAEAPTIALPIAELAANQDSTPTVDPAPCAPQDPAAPLTTLPRALTALLTLSMLEVLMSALLAPKTTKAQLDLENASVVRWAA